ncbi:hypothetical protein TCAL_16199 [Tigriopus californicus]|uniref:Uncharacterized protein n=1 Tax=Tigriopus californicus TaxID=6832 RepID=A0A553P384_TIGCA|nr:hypothetical protein TCAL_16199 [Tigriopus californicus]
MWAFLWLSNLAHGLWNLLSVLSQEEGPKRESKVGTRTRGARTRQRYSRLQQSEPGIELRNAHTSSIMISESDSEDEISFDSPKILNGTTVRNGNTTKRNGFARSQNA